MADTKPSVTLPEEKRQPKTVPMKWLELGVAKDPEFKTQVFLYHKVAHGDGHYYTTGYFKKKEQTENGFEYGFHNDKTGELETDFTHYAICKPPPPVE